MHQYDQATEQLPPPAGRLHHGVPALRQTLVTLFPAPQGVNHFRAVVHGAAPPNRCLATQAQSSRGFPGSEGCYPWKNKTGERLPSTSLEPKATEQSVRPSASRTEEGARETGKGLVARVRFSVSRGSKANGLTALASVSSSRPPQFGICCCRCFV